MSVSVSVSMELITSCNCNTLQFQRPFHAVASSFSLSQTHFPHSLSTRNYNTLRFHPPLPTSPSHTQSLSTTCSVAHDSTLSESFSKTQVAFSFLGWNVYLISVLLNWGFFFWVCLLDTVIDRSKIEVCVLFLLYYALFLFSQPRVFSNKTDFNCWSILSSLEFFIQFLWVVLKTELLYEFT